METPSHGINSDDFRRQEEIKKMEYDSAPINFRYGSGLCMSEYEKLRLMSQRSYSNWADDSSHRTGHTTDYLYSMNANRVFFREHLSDRVDHGILSQLNLNSERNFIQVRKNADPYALRVWMHKQAVSLKNLRAKKKLIHEDGTIAPVYQHTERDWRWKRDRLDVFDPQLLKYATDQLDYTYQCLSDRVRNKVTKMTLKNLYLEQDFTVKRKNHLHASFLNNLPGDVIDDLDEYTK